MKATLLLLVIAAEIIPCTCEKAYISYKNANCLDGQTIEGEMVATYQTSFDFSFSMDYSGECAYYVDGYWDYINDDINDVFVQGYCMTCNGVTGCSSDGTCNNFMTYPVELSSDSGYQLSSNGNAKSNSEVDTPTLTLVQNAQKATKNAFQKSSTFSGSASQQGGFQLTAGSMALVVAVATSALVLGILSANYVRPRDDDDDDEETNKPAIRAVELSSSYRLGGDDRGAFV